MVVTRALFRVPGIPVAPASETTIAFPTSPETNAAPLQVNVVAPLVMPQVKSVTTLPEAPKSLGVTAKEGFAIAMSRRDVIVVVRITISIERQVREFRTCLDAIQHEILRHDFGTYLDAPPHNRARRERYCRGRMPACKKRLQSMIKTFRQRLCGPPALKEDG